MTGFPLTLLFAFWKMLAIASRMIGNDWKRVLGRFLLHLMMNSSTVSVCVDSPGEG
jgi:hypothetical protein